MIRRCSKRTALICIIMCCVLLMAFFLGSTVQADGLGGQWPDSSTDPTTSNGGGESTDGLEVLITLAILTQVIL
jgi:hypothetical protein